MSTVFPYIGQDDNDKYYISTSFSHYLLVGSSMPIQLTHAEHFKAYHISVGQKGSYYYPTREDAEEALKKYQISKGVIREKIEEPSWVTNL